ncbi:hypothetical protein NPX13_g9301 [Xylaria arbuscula]|uniref:CLASP N-terminal domain-containing protein n=1 Tax=Xylaria arbuscula TaxID=114810 RepID=A0A9W8N732_9PEZI|nr:hypothetical protein NPX13_g9301 [Xylaria arbuscula]
MGDQKDKFRTLAIQAMATMYAHMPADAERFVRNVAMVGKNPRAKEASLQWLLQMHKESGLQFRSYVPTLMELLEDADGMVREASKAAVIDLFRDAPNAAKSDLKKQLKNFKVRPAIESAIIKELNPTGVRAKPESRPGSAMQVRPNLGTSTSSISDRPITPMLPEAKTESVEPLYVNTQRELDEIIKDFPDVFVTGCRSLLDGILKAVNSLRTSLSKEGCALVEELAVTFGPGIDPMVELLMQSFIKLCAATKKITSQLANSAVDTIVGRTTYTVRIMQHIWGACQDKNVQPRVYVTGWLKTLLKKEASHKSHLEHHGGLDLIEKCIKKGLADPNPGVREKMRSTYWLYASSWPSRAETIMNNLDSTAQKLLQKDPANPNSPKRSEPAARPGLGLSKSTMGTSKPSLRETMMAQKKALSHRNLPARPGSAMANLSPVRTGPSTSNTSSSQPTTRVRPESSMKSHGGMSVAPMRPARRRPEIAARPATAGPYSVRSHDGPSAERPSPESIRSKAITPKTITGSPKRTAPRPRPGHASTASESNVTATTPTKKPVVKAAASPRISPAKAKPTLSHPPPSSPSQDENLTFVSVPSIDTLNLKESLQPSSPQIIVSPQEASRVDEPTSPEVATPLEAEPSPPPETAQEPENEPENGPEQEKDEVTVLPSTPKATPSKPVQVYEDPVVEDQASPQPQPSEFTQRPALEDIPVNEDAVKLSQVPTESDDTVPPCSPNKPRQESRLLQSGITRVANKSLDVHGFRKLQSLVRENKLPFDDAKFNALLIGLFNYLESPLDGIATQKVQDIKAQVLATIKLLLKMHSDNFQPHISRGLEALLRTRSSYDARTHIVAGLELLADELVQIGDAAEITVTMTRSLGQMDLDTVGYRGLSMGLHVLKELIDIRSSYVPTDREVADLTALAIRCLDCKESGVRMDAVQLCVALHARLGDAKFWDSMKTIRDDPKSLITYYIVKRQRETKTASS